MRRHVPCRIEKMEGECDHEDEHAEVMKCTTEAQQHVWAVSWGM
jgi:hypothetical protein